MSFGIESLGTSAVGDSTTEGLVNITSEYIINYNVLNTIQDSRFKNRWHVLNNINTTYINKYHILNSMDTSFINSYTILNNTVSNTISFKYNIFNNVKYNFINRSVITKQVISNPFNIRYFIFESVGVNSINLKWNIRNDATVFFNIGWELESNITLTATPYEYIYPILDRTFYLK